MLGMRDWSMMWFRVIADLNGNGRTSIELGDEQYIYLEEKNTGGLILDMNCHSIGIAKLGKVRRIDLLATFWLLIVWVWLLYCPSPRARRLSRGVIPLQSISEYLRMREIRSLFRMQNCDKV
jgi:hypothetical protein